MPAARPRHPFAPPAAVALALTLATALAACARPMPTPSPTATPAPSATPTRTPTPSATATPTTTPSPTPTNRALVALSPTEAAGRALWLVNPRNKPRIAFRYYVRMRELPDLFDLVSFEHAIRSNYTTRGDNTLVIVAGVEHTGAFEDGLDPLPWPVFSSDYFAPPRMVVIFDAATGLSLGGGTALPRDFEALRAISPARVTPIAAPSATATGTPAVAQLPAADPPPGTMTTGTPPADRAAPTVQWPAGLEGRPVDPAAIPSALRETLAAWPLLPGNQWVYERSQQYYGAWSGRRITETVTALHVLPGDILVAEVRVAELAAPQTTAAVAAELLDVGGSADRPAGEQVSTLWWVIKDGYVYRAAGLDRDVGLDLLRSILAQVSTLGAAPVVTPEWTPGAPRVYLPELRLPLGADPAEAWDEVADRGNDDPTVSATRDPAAAATDDASKTEAVTTLAGRFDACNRQMDVGMTGGEIRWFCPGVGVVREDGIFNRGWSIRQLVDYSLEATVDALR